MCVVLALFTLLIGASRHNAASSLPDVLYFYLAGVGIRRRSRFAAVSAFAIYLISVVAAVWIAHAGGIVSIFFLALLLSNVRATWVAHNFTTEQPLNHSPLPPDTLLEKFTDLIPRIIWPVGRWFYYALAVLELIGLVSILFHGPAPLPPS